MDRIINVNISISISINTSNTDCEILQYFIQLDARDYFQRVSVVCRLSSWYMSIYPQVTPGPMDLATANLPFPFPMDSGNPLSLLVRVLVLCLYPCWIHIMIHFWDLGLCACATCRTTSGPEPGSTVPRRLIKKKLPVTRTRCQPTIEAVPASDPKNNNPLLFSFLFY